jgi:hypothetical protein
MARIPFCFSQNFPLLLSKYGKSVSEKTSFTAYFIWLGKKYRAALQALHYIRIREESNKKRV